MSAEPAEETPWRLRTASVQMASASLMCAGALLIAIDAATRWEAAVLALGLAAAQVAVQRWATVRNSRVILPCLAVTAAVWLVGALVTGNGTASYGLAVVGTIIVHELPRHRRTVILGLAAFGAATLAARLMVTDDGVADLLLQYVVSSSAVAITAAILTSLIQGIARLAAELDEARARAAELAVVRERMRFASDLHDIQGHTLHVVKLKTTLAQKLLRSDADRAQEELREVHDLVGDTIARTKELAYAQRRLNLSAELENAKNLFEAAGIHVRVDREAEADERVGELLGQVLRETTTNILRHAQARQVHITLAESGITVVNDGAQDAPSTGLRGLATLRERLAESGGELTVEQQHGRFLTAAAFPRAGAAERQASAVAEEDAR
ncbi:sensor histidine kinase [Streptomonospora sediminis]